MYDSALNLIPSTNVAASVIQGAAKPLGRNRSYNAVGRIAGDVTGAGAALALTIEQSANGTTGWTQIAGPLAMTELATIQGTTPRYEIPLAGGIAPHPQRLPFNTTQDFARAVLTPTGTTPAFPLTSVTVEPIDNPVLMSGR